MVSLFNSFWNRFINNLLLTADEVFTPEQRFEMAHQFILTTPPSSFWLSVDFSHLKTQRTQVHFKLSLKGLSCLKLKLTWKWGGWGVNNERHGSCESQCSITSEKCVIVLCQFVAKYVNLTKQVCVWGCVCVRFLVFRYVCLRSAIFVGNSHYYNWSRFASLLLFQLY